MPNWCHNTLTVIGEEAELARFVEDARPSEALARVWWRKAKADKWEPEKRTFKVFFADLQEHQPLSFDAIVPQPSDEELHQLEEREPCDMCGATGTLPESELQAIAQGAKWYPWMDPSERADRTCNVCGGTGDRVAFGKEGWYSWRLENWGCKWDCSFGEPFLALGQEGMDVDETVEAKRATITPTVAVYKFDTPWSPPTPFVEQASEKYPGLEFVLRFGEPGSGFAGECRYVAGAMTEDVELSVEDVLAPEEMWF
jgi:hypothetical protein